VTHRIAVLQLPGVNCEPETCRALERAGLAAEIVRWTRNDLDGFDGFVIPGGFSFQDRVRGGAIAAREPVIAAVIDAAAAGKPVVGICNGAQVLVESGLVPGLESGRVEMALAPNRMPDRRGYYSQWVHLRVDGAPSVATGGLAMGTVLPMPIAHAEGRFVTRDPATAAALEAGGQIVLRYAAPDGGPAGGPPHNPNGSLLDAAGISNAAGNVVAMMPHPERAATLSQVAWELEGAWGGRRRAARTLAALDEAGPGLEIFRAMRHYLDGERSRLAGGETAAGAAARGGGEAPVAAPEVAEAAAASAVASGWEAPGRQVLFLTVALRGADPTALTATYAVRHRLGLGSEIAALERLQLWRFDVAAPSVAEALDRARGWVTQSQLFVNPNQHVYRLEGAGEATRPAVVDGVWIAVGDRPDQEGVAATRLVRERLGGTALVEARRAVVWQLRFAPGVDTARRRACAAEVAVARTRQRGLLANPHYQAAHVVDPPTPAAAARALWDGGAVAVSLTPPETPV
jgi:phosphoribosylformylglycinamidine synthase